MNADQPTTSGPEPAEAPKTSKKSAPERIERDFERRAAKVRPEDEERVAYSIQDKIARYTQSAEKHRPFALRLLGNVKLLWAMLRESNFQLEWTTRGTIIAALLYFISPFDVFPDVLPIVGMIDDAFVLSLVMAQLSGEIERFKQYLRSIIEQSEA